LAAKPRSVLEEGGMEMGRVRGKGMGALDLMPTRCRGAGREGSDAWRKRIHRGL